MGKWIVKEWPHSRALGERWFAFPAHTPSNEPWPGLKAFTTKAEAEAFVAEQTS